MLLMAPNIASILRRHWKGDVHDVYATKSGGRRVCKKVLLGAF